MFKKGDVINVNPPKEYGEWSCLMFTEAAKPGHGNPLKYMGKARPVCQAYQDEPELGRNLFCHSCQLILQRTSLRWADAYRRSRHCPDSTGCRPHRGCNGRRTHSRWQRSPPAGKREGYP